MARKSMAASCSTCGEMHAVFGALRDAQLDMGATLPCRSTYGQHCTPPNPAARTPDTAAMQPNMEHIAYADNGECPADNAFRACRVLAERQPNRRQTWA